MAKHTVASNQAAIQALRAELASKDETIQELRQGQKALFAKLDEANTRLDNAAEVVAGLLKSGKTSRVHRTSSRKTFDPKTTYNCVYCSRDGQDGSGSTQEHINDHGREVSARRKAERKASKATTAPAASPETPSDDDAPME